MRLVCLATLPLVLALVAHDASADQTARLVYARGAGTEACPDESALRLAVGARLGYDPFRPVAPLTVLVNVAHRGGSYYGDLRLLNERGDEVGSRAIDEGNERCDAITSALALSISVAIDPLLLVHPPRAPAPVPAPPDPPPTPPPIAVVHPAGDVRAAAPPPPPATTTVHPFAGAALSGWLGATPSPTVGAALTGGLSFGAWSAALEAKGTLPLSRDEKRVPVSSFLLLGSLVPCAHVSIVFGCAVVSGGLVSASARVAQPKPPQEAAYASLGPRIGLLVPLATHVFLQPSVELGIPLAPRVFEVDGTQVYDPPAVWAAVNVGVIYRR